MKENNQLCNGKKQLIIMGNGFDLLCGLDTTYNCFLIRRLDYQ